LETAWKLNPSDRRIPLKMLTVELGQGKGRPTMERWFTRAMTLETNDYEACRSKLIYLEPKWYGSPEEMLAFGRECVASTKWGGKVPLILLDAHYTLSGYLPKANRGTYWKQPSVWNDVKSSFEKFFELNPQAVSWRHNYAFYAYACEQWDDFNKQLPLLGEINYAYFGGKEAFEKMVQRAQSQK
jgi:hypothetical protein